MFKTILRQMALSCVDPACAATRLTRQGSGASGRSVWVFCGLAALLLTGVVTLPACGPGIGGRGIGPVNLLDAAPAIFYSGVVTVPLPSDPVALPGLSAPMTMPAESLPGLLPPSTVAKSTSATAPCIVNCSTAAITLLLDREAVQLQGQCFGFTSQVAFKIAVSGPTVVPGSFQTLPGTSAGQTGANSLAAALTL